MGFLILNLKTYIARKFKIKIFTSRGILEFIFTEIVNLFIIYNKNFVHNHFSRYSLKTCFEYNIGVSSLDVKKLILVIIFDEHSIVACP